MKNYNVFEKPRVYYVNAVSRLKIEDRLTTYDVVSMVGLDNDTVNKIKDLQKRKARLEEIIGEKEKILNKPLLAESWFSRTLKYFQGKADNYTMKQVEEMNNADRKNKVKEIDKQIGDIFNSGDEIAIPYPVGKYRTGDVFYPRRNNDEEKEIAASKKKEASTADIIKYMAKKGLKYPGKFLVNTVENFADGTQIINVHLLSENDFLKKKDLEERIANVKAKIKPSETSKWNLIKRYKENKLNEERQNKVEELERQLQNQYEQITGEHIKNYITKGQNLEEGQVLDEMPEEAKDEGNSKEE